MYKKVNICDFCQREVAEVKCELCGKDVCNSCGYSVKISGRATSIIYLENLSIPKFDKDKVVICKNCLGKLREEIRQIQEYKDSDVEKDLILNILKSIKNHYKLIKL